MILEAIPYDEWISAGEIAVKVGIRPQAVGIIIWRSLIPVYVERKARGVTKPTTYVYKRLPRAFEPKRLRI